MIHRLITALTAAWATCPHCGWWVQPGHTCHPANR
jgi:hypothetical protein